MTTKKDQLIEYQPHTTHDFEYDLEEEPDFDYAPDELTHVLVDGKSDCTSELQSNPLDINNCVEEEDEEDEQSHQEYNSQPEEFQNFTIHRNNHKIKLTADNVEQLAREVITTEAALEINEESQEPQVFHEYKTENQSIPVSNQWCIKASNAQNIATIQLQKQSGLQTGITNSDLSTATAAGVSSKYVRDVKTMTCSSISQPCCGKPSQSSDILAKSWAVQYDELTPDQKLLARKAINDILFDGCMGRLAINSNGRIVTIDGNNEYTNIKTVTVNANGEEVESGDIYEQSAMATTSSNSSTSGGGVATVTVTANVGGSNSKIHANDEWLKL